MTRRSSPVNLNRVPSGLHKAELVKWGARQLGTSHDHKSEGANLKTSGPYPSAKLHDDARWDEIWDEMG